MWVSIANRQTMNAIACPADSGASGVKVLRATRASIPIQFRQTSPKFVLTMYCYTTDGRFFAHLERVVRECFGTSYTKRYTRSKGCDVDFYTRCAGPQGIDVYYLLDQVGSYSKNSFIILSRGWKKGKCLRFCLFQFVPTVIYHSLSEQGKLA